MKTTTSAPRRCARRRPWTRTAALSLPLLLIGACGTATTTGRPEGGGATGSPTGPGTPGGTPGATTGGTSGGTAGGSSAGSGTATTGPGTAAEPPATPRARTVRTAVYFLHGEHVSAAPRSVATPGTAAAAVRSLLAGPGRYERSHGRTTAIPAGTTLRSLAVRDHVATVDFSGRYDDGGGSLSMRARLAQVVFTLTRFATVDAVRFAVDGKPVERFGGEGIVLNGPVGRADFEDVAPAVLVESPMTGDTVRGPVRVWGSADTFEGVFRLRLTDTAGRTAADVLVRATSGTGTRGTFDVTFPLKTAPTGPGLLTAYYASPKDGRPVTVDTVPLTLRR
ncbi:GerMN domain-containing protein [Streptomyces anandii]|uniref:GerMN domain-containing protein n=1 Tax=Streptomyces anandii TaxID=285454 RepID=UPI003690F2D0